MKIANSLKALFVAGALAISPDNTMSWAQAKTSLYPQNSVPEKINPSSHHVHENICTSNKIIHDAKNKVFILVEWFETKKNNLTFCDHGKKMLTAKIATGKPKKDGGTYTPEGKFTIDKLDANKRSRTYNNAKMPNAMHIDTKRGKNAIWIHQWKVGKNVSSHGCVRVEDAKSRALFDMVKQKIWIGEKVGVIIQGTNPRTKF